MNQQYSKTLSTQDNILAQDNEQTYVQHMHQVNNMKQDHNMKHMHKRKQDNVHPLDRNRPSNTTIIEDDDAIQDLYSKEDIVESSNALVYSDCGITVQEEKYNRNTIVKRLTLTSVIKRICCTRYVAVIICLTCLFVMCPLVIYSLFHNKDWLCEHVLIVFLNWLQISIQHNVPEKIESCTSSHVNFVGYLLLTLGTLFVLSLVGCMFLLMFLAILVVVILFIMVVIIAVVFLIWFLYKGLVEARDIVQAYLYQECLTL
jgi:hypothetical protein